MSGEQVNYAQNQNQPFGRAIITCFPCLCNTQIMMQCKLRRNIKLRFIETVASCNVIGCGKLNHMPTSTLSLIDEMRKTELNRKRIDHTKLCLCSSNQTPKLEDERETCCVSGNCCIYFIHPMIDTSVGGGS